jgi:O-antigen/teichoic acid export membrane protein
MTETPTPQEDGGPSALRARVAALRTSDLGKAGGLAGAMIVNNVIALGSTVVFARLLGDYGALAALISYYLILSVVGQALQVATARESVLGKLGTGPELAATLRSWTRTLLALTAGLAVVSILLRAPIASAVGVKQEWGAAIGLPAGALWLLLSILRGALQGVGDYRAVGLSLIGEQASRLVLGAALAATALDVTGAYLGTPLSLVAMSLYCGLALRRHLAGPADAAAPAAALRLRDHVARAWAPIAGLVVIAVLQNVDIIAAKHRFTTDVASSYAATAVAAKVLVWVAMGAGFYLVPETARRHAEGQDTRPVLARTLAIVLACAVPVLAIFAFGGRLLLKLAFGADHLLAADSLLVLGIAFTLLAVTYLAIQYLLALKRTRFLLPLGAVALAEPLLLLTISPHEPAGFATIVLAVQATATALALAMALSRPRPVGSGRLRDDERAQLGVGGALQPHARRAE